MVEEIRLALRMANASQAAAYDKNAAEYTAKLKKLTDDGKAMITGRVPVGRQQQGVVENDTRGARDTTASAVTTSKRSSSNSR